MTLTTHYHCIPESTINWNASGPLSVSFKVLKYYQVLKFYISRIIQELLDLELELLVKINLKLVHKIVIIYHFCS